MANILVRNLSDEVVDELKRRARRHNRPLQQEVSDILVRAAQQPHIDVASKAAEIRKRLAGKGIEFSDSAELLREDRSR
jgi:plasmid stability protein